MKQGRSALTACYRRVADGCDGPLSETLLRDERPASAAPLWQRRRLPEFRLM